MGQRLIDQQPQRWAKVIQQSLKRPDSEHLLPVQSKSSAKFELRSFKFEGYQTALSRVSSKLGECHLKTTQCLDSLQNLVWWQAMQASNLQPLQCELSTLIRQHHIGTLLGNHDRCGIGIARHH